MIISDVSGSYVDNKRCCPHMARFIGMYVAINSLDFVRFEY